MRENRLSGSEGGGTLVLPTPIIIRPLCGLIKRLLGQSDSTLFRLVILGTSVSSPIILNCSQ